MGHKATFVAQDRGELDRTIASPDPSGNRAQRRAWAKAAKTTMPAAVQLQVDGTYEPVPAPVGRTRCPACQALPIGHEGDCEP